MKITIEVACRIQLKILIMYIDRQVYMCGWWWEKGGGFRRVQESGPQAIKTDQLKKSYSISMCALIRNISCSHAKHSTFFLNLCQKKWGVQRRSSLHLSLLGVYPLSPGSYAPDANGTTLFFAHLHFVLSKMFKSDF